MIHSITSNIKSFKPIKFKPGLNVILAEKAEKSTKRKTRNGLGKSTLLDILHFCLGANTKVGMLGKKNLDKWEFTVCLDLGDQQYAISRNTSNPNKIIINGDCSYWPIKPQEDVFGRFYLSREELTQTLGVLMYDLKLNYEYDYHPTFRSLISYCIRRDGTEGGYLGAFQQHKKQRSWDSQINSAYLLGLGWEFISQVQMLKDRKSTISKLKKETESGVMAELVGNTGELESTKIRLENQVKHDEENLKAFKVHGKYRRIEEKANIITRNMHKLKNINVMDNKILELYKNSLVAEKDANPEQIYRVYEEARLILSKQVTKHISAVLEFHNKIVKNRKSFLSVEIGRLERLISKRNTEVKKLDEEKSILMSTLQTHGSLDEFVQIQANHQKLISELENVTNKLENLKKFEEETSTIAIELESLNQHAKNDLSERIMQKEAAILSFNTYSENLYEVSGTLSINVEKGSYKFGVRIERSGSQGVEKMQIFCHDLMLTKLWANKPVSPRFLVHDSNIFEGVDERQNALALQLAAKESRDNKFQYICAINSDLVPRKYFDSSFDFDSFVATKLIDATVDGSLLGIRF